MKISDYKSAKEDELIHEILQWVKQNNDSAYEESEFVSDQFPSLVILF